MYVERGKKFGQPSFLFTLARWIYVVVVVVFVVAVAAAVIIIILPKSEG